MQPCSAEQSCCMIIENENYRKKGKKEEHNGESYLEGILVACFDRRFRKEASFFHNFVGLADFTLELNHTICRKS